MNRVLRIATSALMCSALAAAAMAQRPSHDPDAAEIAAQLRATGSVGLASIVLRQRNSQHPRPRLDSIADSLAAFVLSHGGRENERAASSAISVLMRAGAHDGEGTPYAGAAERLVRIAENAQGGLRARGVYALSRGADTSEALRRVRAIAASQNPVAYVAVGVLGREMGEAGLLVLRDLYRVGAVTEPQAKVEIGAVARSRGWQLGAP